MLDNAESECLEHYELNLEKYKGENPVLIRIDVNSGHGASNLKKALETISDIYSFIFYNMKLTPNFSGLNYKIEQKKAF